MSLVYTANSSPVPFHLHHMARKSAKFLQEIQLKFETGDEEILKTFTVKWEKTGVEPGKFLIEGESVEINGQEIAMSACRSTDITKLCELWQNSLQNKIKREALKYTPYLYVRCIDKIRKMFPDADDIMRGYSTEFAWRDCVTFLATNSRGSTYYAADEHGYNARLLTAEGAAEMKAKLVPMTMEELGELQEKIRNLIKDVDQQLKSCYATVVDESKELLSNTVTTLTERAKANDSSDHIDFTSVISRYIT